MKKSIVKIGSLALSILALCTMLLLPAAAEVNVEAGLNSAWNTLSQTGMKILTGVVVGIGCFVALTMILINIIGLVKKRSNGEGYSGNITGIAISIVSLVLVASFPAWGPLILGAGA